MNTKRREDATYPKLRPLLPSPSRAARTGTTWGGVRGVANPDRTDFASRPKSHLHGVVPCPALSHSNGGGRHVATAAFFVFACLALTTSAFAVEPDEILKDAKLEARARSISTELRCLVCQNQSIDDSNAPLARDLRLIVRERLVAGASDAEVKQFIVARYGEFALLRPRLSAATLLLWATPLLLLAGAAMMLLRRRQFAGATEAPPLSDAEARRLSDLLGDTTRTGNSA